MSFTYPGVVEGTQVMYAVPSGDTQVDGLHPGSVYTVLDATVLGAGTNLIRLGSLIDMSGVDPLTETITFAAGHGFLAGDCVWYDPRGGASIIGVPVGESRAPAPAARRRPTGAQRFFVRVIDPTRSSSPRRTPRRWRSTTPPSTRRR